MRGLHVCGREGGRGGGRKRGGGGGGRGRRTDPRGLPQHLQLLRGVPRLVLQAPPAQACPQLLLLLGLVGGQLLKPQTQTHVHKTPSLLPLCKLRAAWAAAALSQGGWQRRPPAAPAPIEQVRSPGPLRCWRKNRCSPSRCLFGRHPWSRNPPRPGESRLPWGHFHSDAIQPFPALCLCTGWEGPQPPVLLRAVYCGAC